MTFDLHIDLGNDAMQSPANVAAALLAVIGALEKRQTSGKVRDNNGNSVGTWRFKA